MENRVNYILVGVFVIGLFLASLGAILWLGKYSEDQVFKLYKVNTKDSISGLSEKAPVKLRGVAVGEVKKIEINTKNSEEVSITIQVKLSTPIKEDTYAMIEPQGITGLSFLQLSGGSNESPALQTSNDEEKMGIIPARASIFTRVDETLEVISKKTEDVLTKTDQVMDKTNTLLNEKNLKNLEKTLENSAKLSESLASLTSSIDAQKRRIDNILKQALELESASIDVAKKMSQMSSTITESVKNVGVSMMEKMSSAADSVKKTMDNAEKKLSSGMLDIKGTAKEFIEPTNDAINELNSLLIQTEELIKQLQESPSDLLYKQTKPKLAPGEER